MSFNTDISSKLENSRYGKVLIYNFISWPMGTAWPLHVWPCALCSIRP